MVVALIVWAVLIASSMPIVYLSPMGINARSSFSSASSAISLKYAVSPAWYIVFHSIFITKPAASPAYHQSGLLLLWSALTNVTFPRFCVMLQPIFHSIVVLTHLPSNRCANSTIQMTGQLVLCAISIVSPTWSPWPWVRQIAKIFWLLIIWSTLISHLGLFVINGSMSIDQSFVFISTKLCPWKIHSSIC